MKILKLHFKNLNSLVGEWTIDFTAPEYSEQGIFAITGPTGAGKSTILDAICLSLYGRTPRLDKINTAQNEIMSRQSGECSASLEFKTATGHYRTLWSQSRARKKPAGNLQGAQHIIEDCISNKTLEDKLKVNFISSNSMLNFIFGNCVSAHAMLFKKEIVDFLNFPRNIYFDQYIAMVCASKNGVKYINKNLVLYRQHSNNTLAQNGFKKRKSIFYKIKTKLEKKIKDNEELKDIVNVMKNISTINEYDKNILEEYSIYLNQFSKKYFNLNLFLFLYKNRELLFPISRKSKFKQSFNKSIGYKLYKVFPFL